MLVRSRVSEYIPFKSRVSEYISFKSRVSEYPRVSEYRIAGKFGGEKVWRIWRIADDSPNQNHPN